ncbi:MATE family efflux transporter [Pleionea sp. CnH1-48]|uniref:MATE family efflux transporter n=1 Tax=Pleionea sp. CnH1-48 TaxID=2954494 RepID=UPI0020972368|nr:MATE family efflux transporter [Pleionea sp. CnH1-48]MCO7225158.1 MATE family efflux transporter [Pleionea sp. CnH1-48]
MMTPYWRNPALHQQTFRLAIPMILSNLTVPLTGLVDTAVIGHLDESHYLGATAVGSLIVTMILWAMGFLRMGTTGFAAQAFGAQDNQDIRRVLLNACLLALGISAVVLACHTLIWLVAIYFIDGSQAVKELGQVYFDIRIWAIPAMLLRYVFIGWLLGMQNARVPLYILLVTNITNIALDLVFVIGLDMGVAGVAWASLIADYLGLLIGGFYIARLLRRHPVVERWLDLIRKSALQALLNLNRDIFIRTLALELVFYLMTANGAKLGDDVLAANAVLMNFVLLLSYGLDGFAHAVEALVGKYIGAKDRYQFMGAIVVAGIWSLICSLLFALIYAVFGTTIIDILTSIESVNQIAQEYLIYLIGLPIIAVWSYWLDGIFVGATRAKEMRNSMLIAVITVYVPVLWLLQPLGNHGIWIAFYCFMFARALGLWVYFVKLDKQKAFC